MATFDFVKLHNQWKIHLMQKNLSEWNENDKQIAQIIGFVKKDPEEIIKSAKKENRYEIEQRLDKNKWR